MAAHAQLASIICAQGQPPLSVSTLADLDRLLDAIEAESAEGRPTIAEVTLPGLSVTIGLGSARSFVQLTGSGSGSPYMVTVGDPAEVGVATFYYQGEHHTEIAGRHLIPCHAARDIVREVFTTGRRPSTGRWEEV